MITHYTYCEIESEILQVLESGLSEKLTYHNLEHTRYVLKNVETISRYENISEQETYLIKIAALYHDSGFLNAYANHEKESCKLARKYLKKHKLSSSDIQKISGMILATKIPQKPQNNLEMILADADLEYLGTEQYKYISGKLFKEFQNFNQTMLEEEWLRIQIDFFRQHIYFTNFCIKYRLQQKETNFENLLDKT